jgi:hypothetical protein
VLVTGCSATQQVPDSPENRAERAGELAALAVELGAHEQVLDRGVESAWGPSLETLQLELGRTLTEDEQAGVRKILRSVLAEFLTTELWQENIAAVYAEHFTATELQSLLEFYDSPLGRKTLELDETLSQEFDDSLDVALDPRVDEFIARVDEELAKAFEELGAEEGS